MNRRTTVETLLDHMPARAQLVRGHAAPANIGREALACAGSAGFGIESVRVAITKKQYVTHSAPASPRKI